MSWVQPRCASVLKIRVESAGAVPNAKVVLTYSHTDKYAGILALKRAAHAAKGLPVGLANIFINHLKSPTVKKEVCT